MDWADFLIIAGGVLQALGFALVAWDLAMTQRREIGRFPIVDRFWEWLRRVLGLTKTVEGSAVLSGEGKVTGSMIDAISAEPASSSVEDRLEALERNFAYRAQAIEQMKRKPTLTARRRRRRSNGSSRS